MQKENSIINKLKAIGASIKHSILLDKDDFSPSQKLTNKALVNQLVNRFVKEMHDRSMENTMVFPMCFFIDLSDADFLRMKQDFPSIIIELKGKLLDKIENERTKYVNCDPPASQWYFEFRTNEHIDIPNGGEITNGKPNIHIQLRGKRKSTDTNPTDTNQTFNRKDDVSDKVRFESGMWENERIFTPLYGRLPSGNVSSPKRDITGSGEEVYAVLEENGNKFYMMQQEIHISGKNNSSKLPKTIMKLNVNLTPSKYAVIKYRPNKEQKFSIETYGPLCLNDKSIELNKPYQLFPGSIIAIPTAQNPAVKIKFSTNKT